MKTSEIFEQIVANNIKRDGINDLMEFIRTSDFYEAPGSTKYHNAEYGGLAEHSIEVYDNLFELKTRFDLSKYSDETLTIVSLFHDLCKTNFYKESFRNVKDSSGNWTKVATFVVDDQFPIGYSEKSVIMLMKYIKLTDEEIMAIRWHMETSDLVAQSYIGSCTLTTAEQNCKLISYLHLADFIAAKGL